MPLPTNLLDLIPQDNPQPVNKAAYTADLLKTLAGNVVRGVSKKLLYDPETKRPLPNSPLYALADANKIQDQAMKQKAISDILTNSGMQLIGGVQSQPGALQNIVGNKQNVIGALVDVDNYDNLNPSEQIDAIQRLVQVASDVAPKALKNKEVNKLLSSNAGEWMQRIANEIVKKTKLTSMSQSEGLHNLLAK